MLKEILLSQLSDGKPKKISTLMNLFNCSNAEIQNAVQSIEAAGIAHFEQYNQMLCLNLPLEPLDAELLQKLCPTQRIFVLTIVDSTNSFLARKKDTQNGDVCLSEWQSAGRGRAGKTWFSPFAGQALFSMFWRYYQQNALAGLSVRLGIAAALALQGAGFSEVKLKWPNDLYLQHKKLGGILPEITTRGEVFDVVAGMGINLIPCPNLPENSAFLPTTAGIARNRLLARLISAWQQAFLRAEQERIHPRLWQKLDLYYGQEVMLFNDHEKITGKNLGIDDKGRILLQKNGHITAFYSGEMHLRPCGA